MARFRAFHCFALMHAAWLVLAALWAAAAQAQTPEPSPAPPQALRVDNGPTQPVWPAARVLLDPSGQLDAATVAGQGHRFQRPAGTAGNLGLTAAAVWLRVPVHVPGEQAQHRLLELDYPALNHIDAYLLRAGQLAQHQRMGNTLKLSERPLPSRSHVAAFVLPPGHSELLIRVQTTSSMVLPIRLLTAEQYTLSEARTQLLQGLITGLALCMLIYSLSHWVTLRDRAFVDYSMLLVGNILFTLTNFGIGGQYLWPEWPAVSMNLSPMAVLLAVAGGTPFMRSALSVAEVNRRLDRVIQLTGYAASTVLLISLSGQLPYGLLQGAATGLGLLAMLLVLPAGWAQARRGQGVARYMLIGWAFYVCGAISAAGLLRGFIEPTAWTQYLYPLSTMAEMSAWMAVLSLRVKSIHRLADRARIESEALRALAQTDPLTGLVNRRGLQDRLSQALQTAGSQHPVAVYLIDLDGFKPVNDRHGHDVGDALLVAVGRRLQAQLRQGDVVARLGGDEFVVLAPGVDGDQAARAMGEKMLASFKAPFDALGYRCSVGLTIGYALAPLDGVTSEALIKRADEAMYAGKQAGRGCVLRAQGSSPQAQTTAA